VKTSEPLSQLRALRRAHDMSLRELAERIGLDPGQLSRLERRQAALTVDRLYSIAQALEVKPLARVLEPYTVVEE